ncbi:hypothetical protein N0V93_001286 [Gnomoniopsis smithogilvyi]|uniref:AAA+ ATPase domain-containing protein n=1 Tax=Gnomoniopsis smithogilvyi TaxID=1191159 RepID=A0A9W8Z5L9_9PEZI|nr:hypothetical protein N0V93_001286 [Gnomoniopsis smithogilvyi]
MNGTRPSQAALISTAFAATVVAAIVVCDISLPRSWIDNVRRRIAKCVHSLAERLSPPETSGQQQVPEEEDEIEAEAEFKEAAFEPPYYLPSWFLKNCVITAEDLETSNIPLSLSNSADSSTDQGESFYDLDAAVFENLRTLIQHEPSSETPTSSQSFFNYDATILRTPNSSDSSGEGFLQAILQKLAKEIGADMITLRTIDLTMLCSHFALDQAHASDSDQAFARFFKVSDSGSSGSSTQGDCRETHASDGDIIHDDGSGDGDRQSDITSAEEPQTPFPFNLLLDAPAQKRLKSEVTLYEGSREPRPLLVLWPDVFFSVSTVAWDEALSQLRKAVGVVNSQSIRAMMVGLDSVTVDYWTSEEAFLGDDGLVNNSDNRWSSYWHYDSMLSVLGSEPLCVQPIIPRRTYGQQDLFKKHLELMRARDNIRMIQEKLRKLSGSHSHCALMEPYAIWDATSQETKALDILKQSILSPRVCEFVAACVHKEISIERIAKALERRSMLLLWLTDESKKDLEDSTEEQNPWHNLPESAQEAIKRITSDKTKYEWENFLLDRLVNSDDIKFGWSDIELEDDVKGAITQVVDLANSDATSQSGILRNSRVNGALLYGPPGTGKTHLARVLAREYGAVMIHVSGAEIESKWVGETEKIIKGLFSLAVMVAPSIIFIDEADSMFRKRRSDDADWVRSRVNTFLGQSDGLLKAERPPFLLLATNHPNELDEAVLRRVPGRLYIGLPSQAARKNMLVMFLREESMEPEMRLGDIAAMTSGFTGSDLRNLCVQAALVSQAEAQGEQHQDGGRVLRFAHFQDAMRRCGPTVSSDAIDAIREFARKFDNNAVEKVGLSYSAPDVAKRMKTPGRTLERGTVNQAANWLKSENIDINGDSTLSLNDWKQSSMYPYITEELYQEWSQDRQA